MWDTTEEKLLHYGIQWKKNSFVVGYNGRKFAQLPEIAPHISYNGGKPLLLYPTTVENFFHCIPHNRGKPPPLHPTRKKCCCICISQRQKTKFLNNYTKVNFSAKWYLPMNQEAPGGPVWWKKLEVKNLVVLSFNVLIWVISIEPFERAESTCQHSCSFLSFSGLSTDDVVITLQGL